MAPKWSEAGGRASGEIGSVHFLGVEESGGKESGPAGRLAGRQGGKSGGRGQGTSEIARRCSFVARS